MILKNRNRESQKIHSIIIKIKKIKLKQEYEKHGGKSIDFSRVYGPQLSFSTLQTLGFENEICVYKLENMYLAA